MPRRLLLLMLALASVTCAQRAQAHPEQTRLTVNAWQYEVRGNVVTALKRSGGHLAWQRPAPAQHFYWLGEADGMLIGVGKERKRYLVGNNPKDVYDTAEFNTVFGLSAATGREVWRSRELEVEEPRLLGRAVLYSYGNGAYAFVTTDVLNAASGKIVLSTRGALHPDRSTLVFDCVATPVPYCGGTDEIDVDRVNVNTLRVEQWRLPVPQVSGCSYADNSVSSRARYDAQRLDYLLENLCGYVFARYFWSRGPNQMPIVRQLKSATWPTLP